MLTGIDGLAFVHLGRRRRRAPPDRRRHRRRLRAQTPNRRTSGLQASAAVDAAGRQLTMSEPGSTSGGRDDRSCSRRADRRRRRRRPLAPSGARRAAAEGARGRADADLRRPRRDRRAQRRAHGQARADRRAVVPARSIRRRRRRDAGVPVLLGDVVICPAVAVEARRPTHAGTVDDELALLVVHGVLHVLGHDHAEPGESDASCAARELELLEQYHWHGPAPAGFRQEHHRDRMNGVRSGDAVAIIFMLLLLIVLAVAETGLDRAITRSKARALADAKDRSSPARRCAAGRASGAVHQPAARHGHHAADGQACARRHVRRPLWGTGRLCAIGASPSTSSCSSCSPRPCPRRRRSCTPSGGAAHRALRRCARVVPAVAADLSRG